MWVMCVDDLDQLSSGSSLRLACHFDLHSIITFQFINDVRILELRNNHPESPLGQFSAVRSPLGQSIQPVNCPFSTSHSSGSSSRDIITFESPLGQSNLGQLLILCLSGTFNILGAISSYSLRTLGLPSLHVRNQSKCTRCQFSYTTLSQTSPSHLVLWTGCVCLVQGLD